MFDRTEIMFSLIAQQYGVVLRVVATENIFGSNEHSQN